MERVFRHYFCRTSYLTSVTRSSSHPRAGSAWRLLLVASGATSFLARRERRQRRGAETTMDCRQCQRQRWFACVRPKLMCRPNRVKIQTEACLQPRVPRPQKGSIPARRPAEAGYGGGGGAPVAPLAVVVRAMVRLHWEKYTSPPHQKK